LTEVVEGTQGTVDDFVERSNDNAVNFDSLNGRVFCIFIIAQRLLSPAWLGGVGAWSTKPIVYLYKNEETDQARVEFPARSQMMLRACSEMANANLSSWGLSSYFIYQKV